MAVSATATKAGGRGGGVCSCACTEPVATPGKFAACTCSEQVAGVEDFEVATSGGVWVAAGDAKRIRQAQLSLLPAKVSRAIAGAI